MWPGLAEQLDAMPRPFVVAIAGPTATGKTSLGVELAQHLNTEVISADSQLVYQGLTIGTAKPTEAERQGIPHHLIDRVPPTQAYSASDYRRDGLMVLAALIDSRQCAVVVGGTGFYFQHLLQQPQLPDVPPNEAFRSALQAQELASPGCLHQRLTGQDSERAKALHPNDTMRLIRALEIIEATGEPVPTKVKAASPWPVLWLGLGVQDRTWLWQRIEQRVDAMLTAGWLEEVEQLMGKYGPDCHALQVAHGYPELVEVLQGKRSLADAREQIVINVRQYSRRQFVWFKRNPEIQWHWVDSV